MLIVRGSLRKSFACGVYFVASSAAGGSGVGSDVGSSAGVGGASSLGASGAGSSAFGVSAFSGAFCATGLAASCACSLVFLRFLVGAVSYFAISSKPCFFNKTAKLGDG